MAEKKTKTKEKEKAKASLKKSKRALCISINLLPPEYRKVKKDLSWVTDRRIIWPTVALIIAIIGFLYANIQIDETITNLQNEVSRVKSEVERERPLLTKIGELEQKQAIVNTKINALKSIQVSKKRWVVLFENVSSVLPPNMWLTSLNQVSEDNLEMKGMTFDFSEVAEYMVKLEKQASVEKVSLMTISTTKVDGEEAYSFTIKVVMKKDLGDG
ncbi:PilN domain-containing protein [Fibrobacter sp. UWR2]|jgi:type IV pilus assembly protein PilN|uniref:PilN domain-containing protein n=1 Tax=Fibrobacter sp. UWR2 TaxID=1964352 RepID=UPI000B524D6B|nr:PilN domain-containing protein [Fibrobacter sp. UWR2]MBR4347873.1 PilN domain-containing protein [Fibrobacter sp.]OWU99729.1 fimbrial assembly protein [Fibrobacter sp. UWR2]